MVLTYGFFFFFCDIDKSQVFEKPEVLKEAQQDERNGRSATEEEWML